MQSQLENQSLLAEVIPGSKAHGQQSTAEMQVVVSVRATSLETDLLQGRTAGSWIRGDAPSGCLGR